MTEKEERSFKSMKFLLTQTPVLAHYDKNKEVHLECDASPVGIGAVLSQRMTDGTIKPIAYASRTLSIAEKNYPQIEREALAITFGVKKFHQYLFGRHFTLVTDCKPLTQILHPQKAIPQLAALRIQRWAMLL